jgi:hypothetical protein
LREILATLKAIDGKLTPPGGKPPEFKPGARFKPGRVFSIGQTIPPDVDLVVGDGGLRWRRLWDEGVGGRLPTERWTPRDVDGPVLGTNELLGRGHVTEVPAPDSEAGT